MSRPEQLTVALAQCSPLLGDVERNVDRAAALGHEAAGRGATLVVLPELALTGYSLKDLVSEVARPANGAAFEPLRTLSRTIGIAAGFVEQGEDGALYNAAGYWQGGELIGLHRKIYLPTYGLFDEGRFLARGRSMGAFDGAPGRMGMLICEDLWHPSTVYVTCQDGAQLLLVLSASPTREPGGPEGSRVGSVWYDLLRAHAVLHGVYVVFVNRVGFEDGVNFWGGSGVVGPDGAVRIQAPMFDEGLTLVEIDLADIRRERTRSHHVWEEDAELTLQALAGVLKRRHASTPAGAA